MTLQEAQTKVDDWIAQGNQCPWTTATQPDPNHNNFGNQCNKTLTPFSLPMYCFGYGGSQPAPIYGPWMGCDANGNPTSMNPGGTNCGTPCPYGLGSVVPTSCRSCHFYSHQDGGVHAVGNPASFDNKFDTGQGRSMANYFLSFEGSQQGILVWAI